MENFTPIESSIGGLIIGLASALMLLANGRIAGISGITGGFLVGPSGDRSWRAFFLVGMALGGIAMAMLWADGFVDTIDRSYGALVVAGLLVGVGTRMGNGCTSGHGICGLSRLSPRSFAAVMTFMLTAALTVFVTQSLLGGNV